MSRKTISYCLFPLTMWYAIGVAFRNFLFLIGVKKETSPQVTTISVGNLATGGTGKTPMVEHLIGLLGDEFSVALLSRGYKRKTKGFLLADEHATAETIGDEPYMMHSKFPHVATAVCEKRLEGIRQLLSLQQPPQLVLMDDAYQHRYVKPSLNILLTEYQCPYYRDQILPFGNLREFKSARSRANIVVVTKSPEKINPIEKHLIIGSLGLKPYQKVFFSSIVYGDPIGLFGDSPSAYTPQVLLVTGIAHPQPLVDEVSRHAKVAHLAFADHHDFAAADLEHIRSAYAKLPQGSMILTTEKDAARLIPHREALNGLPISYLPITVKVHPNGDIDFDQVVLKTVRENVQFLDKLHSNPMASASKASPLMR